MIVGVTYPKRWVRKSASKISMTLLPSLISTGTPHLTMPFQAECIGYTQPNEGPWLIAYLTWNRDAHRSRRFPPFGITVATRCA